MKQDVPKFQLQSRPTTRISVNDALTQNLFSMTADEFMRTINGEERKFLEAKTKKHGVITSSYWLKCLDDEHVKISEPLDELDRAILDACISAQQAGCECLTLRGIWRDVTGKQDADFKLTPALKKEMFERVNKLFNLRLTVDITDACRGKIYADGTKFRIRAPLLPCEILEAAEINGQLVPVVIVFKGESLLLRIARARNGNKKQSAQILRYPVELLDIPHQRDTPAMAAVKNYLVRRIETAKRHNNVARCIRFSTLMSCCGLSDADRFKKREVRKVIKNVMEALVDTGEIRNFSFLEEKRAVAKITFEFGDTKPT